MNKRLLAICQVCIHCDFMCLHEEYNMTLYSYKDHYDDKRYESDQNFYNTCSEYEPDWILLIRYGIKEWIPK